MGMTFFVGLGLTNSDDSGGFAPLGNNVGLLTRNPRFPEFPKILDEYFDGLNSGARTLKRLFDDCCR